MIGGGGIKNLNLDVFFENVTQMAAVWLNQLT